MNRRLAAPSRVWLIVALFVLALAAILWNWHVQPPVSGLTGTRKYGRNISGDLQSELQLIACEFGVVLLALQPWTQAPRRSWIGFIGLALGAWGVLRLLSGLHAPPIALPHDLLLLVLGVVLPFLGLAIVPRTTAMKSKGSAT